MEMQPSAEVLRRLRIPHSIRAPRKLNDGVNGSRTSFLAGQLALSYAFRAHRRGTRQAGGNLPARNTAP